MEDAKYGTQKKEKRKVYGYGRDRTYVHQVKSPMLRQLSYIPCARQQKKCLGIRCTVTPPGIAGSRFQENRV